MILQSFMAHIAWTLPVHAEQKYFSRGHRSEAAVLLVCRTMADWVVSSRLGCSLMRVGVMDTGHSVRQYLEGKKGPWKQCQHVV